jgi:hypothetical protein
MLFIASLLPASAHASESTRSAADESPAVPRVTASIFAPLTAPTVSPIIVSPIAAPRSVASSRPPALAVSYVAHAALQSFDVYTTLRALGGNAVERNPVMRGLVGHPAAFVAVKGVLGATTILAAETLWKRGHRVPAIAVMALSNGLLAAVVANNAAVLRK